MMESYSNYSNSAYYVNHTHVSRDELICNNNNYDNNNNNQGNWYDPYVMYNGTGTGYSSQRIIGTPNTSANPAPIPAPATPASAAGRFSNDGQWRRFGEVR